MNQGGPGHQHGGQNGGGWGAQRVCGESPPHLAPAVLKSLLERMSWGFFGLLGFVLFCCGCPQGAEDPREDPREGSPPTEVLPVSGFFFPFSFLGMRG